MDKNDIVRNMSKNSSLTPEQSLDVYDAVISIMTQTLKEDEAVRIYGFGRFSPREKETRRNEKSSAPQEITRTCSFSSGKLFREMVKQKKNC